MKKFKYQNPTPEVDGKAKSIVLPQNDKDIGRYEKFSDSTYFAFIDVLGFKNDYYESEIRSKDRESHDENESPAQKYDEIFTTFFDLIDKSKVCTTGRAHAGQTSDSLFFYTDRADYLANFIRLFSYFSAYSMTKGVFFRGGIGCGNLYCRSAHMFYGQSVINAYLLESVIAKNPVIAIDRTTYQALQETELQEDTYFYLDEHNGRYYINPFAYFCEDFSLPFETESINEELIVKNIDAEIERFEYEPSTYSKYLKLRDFYNRKSCI